MLQLSNNYDWFIVIKQPHNNKFTVMGLFYKTWLFCQNHIIIIMAELAKKKLKKQKKEAAKAMKGIKKKLKFIEGKEKAS